MNNMRLLLVAIMLSLLSVPFISAGVDASAPRATTAIATRAAASDDCDIAARNRTIFEQIKVLQHVIDRVSSGVVMLTGTSAGLSWFILLPMAQLGLVLTVGSICGIASQLPRGAIGDGVRSKQTLPMLPTNRTSLDT